VFLGALLGVLTGLTACVFSRFTFHKHLHTYQTMIVFLFAFLGFFFGETLHSSGILSMMFCGMFMSRYLKYNVAKKSRVTTEYMMSLLSSITESLIFLYLGISIVISVHVFDWTLILMANIGILLFRILFVFAADSIDNMAAHLFFSGKGVVPRREILIQSLSGLRGAIAFALAYVLHEPVFSKMVRNTFITTVLTCVVFTVFVQGTLLSSFLFLFRIEKKRLTTPDKVRLYKHMLKYLTKMLYYLRIHDDMSTHLKTVLVNELNLTFGKLQNLTQSVHEKMTRAHEETKDKYYEKHLEENEEDMKIVEQLCNFTNSRKGLFVNVDAYFGVVQGDIEQAVAKQDRIIYFQRTLSNRIATHLRDAMEEKYALTDEKGYGKGPLRYARMILGAVDKLIQSIVNRGYLKKEKRFIRTLNDYRYHCNGSFCFWIYF